MSKEFHEALKSMYSEHSLLPITLEKVYDDISELAERMGVEAKSEVVDPQDWSGEGLPPVGCVCEYRCQMTGNWKRSFIAAHHINGEEALWTESTDGGRVFYGVASDFRPARIERERAIDSGAPDGIICPAGLTAAEAAEMARQQTEYLYDLGWRPPTP